MYVTEGSIPGGGRVTEQARERVHALECTCVCTGMIISYHRIHLQLQKSAEKKTGGKV